MLYKDIAKKLRARINSDEFAVGDLLPTERQLMQEYQVSRVSIRKAIEELVALKLIEKRRGSGTYVTHKAIIHQLNPLRGGLEWAQHEGVVLPNQILASPNLYADSEIANQLNLDTTDRVYQIKRLRIYDDRPQIFEESYMPVALFPELSIRVLEGSKFEYIEKVMGLEIKSSVQQFEPVMPDK